MPAPVELQTTRALACAHAPPMQIEPICLKAKFVRFIVVDPDPADRRLGIGSVMNAFTTQHQINLSPGEVPIWMPNCPYAIIAIAPAGRGHHHERQTHYACHEAGYQ